MLKILIKTLVLVFIILSVFFIVHPQACSNLMLGRVVNSTVKEPVISDPLDKNSELFVPAGDRVEPHQPGTRAEQAAPKETVVVTDTNSLAPKENASESGYSQEDIDYAIASRYVELENEYAQKNQVTKDSAKEISYQVMDDFELTAQEWEAFLQRATQTNLFNQIRTEMAAQK